MEPLHFWDNQPPAVTGFGTVGENEVAAEPQVPLGSYSGLWNYSSPQYGPVTWHPVGEGLQPGSYPSCLVCRRILNFPVQQQQQQQPLPILPFNPNYAFFSHQNYLATQMPLAPVSLPNPVPFGSMQTDMALHSSASANITSIYNGGDQQLAGPMSLLNLSPTSSFYNNSDQGYGSFMSLLNSYPTQLPLTPVSLPSTGLFEFTPTDMALHPSAGDNVTSIYNSDGQQPAGSMSLLNPSLNSDFPGFQAGFGVPEEQWQPCKYEFSFSLTGPSYIDVPQLPSWPRGGAPARIWTRLNEDALRQRERELLDKLRRNRRRNQIRCVYRESILYDSITKPVELLYEELERTKLIRPQHVPDNKDGTCTTLPEDGPSSENRSRSASRDNAKRARIDEKEATDDSSKEYLPLIKRSQLECDLATLLHQREPFPGSTYKFPEGDIDHSKIATVLSEWLKIHKDRNYDSAASEDPLPLGQAWLQDGEVELMWKEY